MIELPYPPSMNNYWKSRIAGPPGKQFVSTYVTVEGKAFRREVAARCVCAKPFGNASLEVKIALYPPDRRRRDIDNPIKPLLDALEHAKIYDDDSQICVLTVERFEPVTGGEALVEIKEILENT